MKYYRDLNEYLKVLEDKGKLVRIKRPIDKDTELHPLVRWQFRGLPEEQRKAFLFEKVTDARGRKYSIPVLVACHAASRQVYAAGMMCGPEGIMEKWTQAQLHPVKPRMVASGPVYEEIHVGDKLLEHGGLGEFPIPISTPGFDNAPYLTAANWVTKDPETGIPNVGNYRAMVKSQTRTGVFSEAPQHLHTHWQKCKAKGISLQAAIVIGPTPNIGFVATAKIPYGANEFAIAGGIAGEPVKLVKCKTVGLEVPASAQIVIEGEIPTDCLEREAPFGEFSGYVGVRKMTHFFNVTCIAHRKYPIYNAFISQFPPSESSKLRQVAYEAVFYKFLKHDCDLPGILDVAFHESGGSAQYCVIRMKKSHPAEPARVLNGVMALSSRFNRVVIVVDEDIDPRDCDSVNWALSFRMQPHRDVRTVMNRIADLDPSAAPPGESEGNYPGPAGQSSLLIDATRKWDYPPVSLPAKEFMDNARKIWEKEGLPALNPRVPWHGYSLGLWTGEDEAEAQLAVRGEYYQTGDKVAAQRQKV
ncbi:MAG: UbiD family decarboxylase [Chloroflexi bacterium]|nr:UbiD family decarboxylase [Chloroflexota bacterium]